MLSIAILRTSALPCAADRFIDDRQPQESTRKFRCGQINVSVRSKVHIADRYAFVLYAFSILSISITNRIYNDIYWRLRAKRNEMNMQSIILLADIRRLQIYYSFYSRTIPTANQSKSIPSDRTRHVSVRQLICEV